VLEKGFAVDCCALDEIRKRQTSWKAWSPTTVKPASALRLGETKMPSRHREGDPTSDQHGGGGAGEG